MSSLRPVTWVAPWVKLVLMPAVRTPRPIWAGLVAPVFAPGAVAPRRVWLNASAKTTWEDLNPVVFTLAMLLPVTSIICW
jgi:hypothetical protein